MLGIYARISKEKEETDRSIEDQIQTGVELAEKLNLTYRIYREADGTSGSLPIDKRPELKRLVDDILSNEINAVYAFDQSRLERNVETNFILKRLFKDFQIKLYFQGGLQAQSLETDLAGDIISRVNQYYLEITKKKIKSVLNRNAKEGRRFSFIQFGYMEGKDKKLVINEEEAEIVKTIFALSLEGMGTAKIAEELNRKEILTRYNQKEGTYRVVNKYTKEVSIRQKKDVKWKGGTIRNIITNPIYKGERRWNENTYPVPPIFEEWYWQKVNDNLKNNSNNRGKRVEHSYLLKGLLRCGKCGSNYYGRTRVAKDGKKPKDNYYTCSSKRKGEQNCGNGSVNIEALDNLIWLHMLFGGRMRQLLEGYFNNDENSNRLAEINKEWDNLNNKVSEIDHKRNKLLEAVEKEALSLEDIASRNLELKRQKEAVEVDLRRLEDARENLKSISKAELEKLNPRIRMNDFSIEQKRELISQFIKNIIILRPPKGETELTIQFKMYGLKDEVYHITKNNVYANNKPSNKLMEMTNSGWVEIDETSFDLRGWKE